MCYYIELLTTKIHCACAKMHFNCLKEAKTANIRLGKKGENNIEHVLHPIPR